MTNKEPKYMQEFKGTLGSWISEENMDEPRLDTIWSNEILIAKTCYSPASKANAKLISAAPELLQACIKTLQYFKDASDAGKYPEFLLQENGGEGFQYLEQAIQKALTL